jgi:O-antigen/teichoic acid export membrane protein
VPGIRWLTRVPAAVRWDYLATALSHCLTLASGLLLFYVVARRAGVAGFAYYQIARGVVATVQPLALLGLVPALHRYLPRAGRRVRVLARQAFLLEIVALNVFGLTALLLAEDVGRLLGIGGAREARAVVVLTAGVCLCTVAVAALRGCGEVRRSILLSLVGLGVLPVAAFAVTDRMDVFLTVQGAALAAVACWGIAGVGSSGAERRPPGPAPAPSLLTLLRYGVRRTPGDIALPAMFAFPTFFVAGVSRSAADVAYVGFTTSAITLICSIFGILTPVLLPRLSRHTHDAEAGDRGFNPDLAHGLRVLPLAAAGVAAVACVLLAAIASPVVRWFLGIDFDGAEVILRFGVPVSIPLAAYYAARPAIDALRETPVTARLLIGSLVVEVLVTYGAALALPAWPSALLGFGAAAAVLAVLSYVALLRVIPPAVEQSRP